MNTLRKLRSYDALFVKASLLLGSLAFWAAVVWFVWRVA